MSGVRPLPVVLGALIAFLIVTAIIKACAGDRLAATQGGVRAPPAPSSSGGGGGGTKVPPASAGGGGGPGTRAPEPPSLPGGGGTSDAVVLEGNTTPPGYGGDVGKATAILIDARQTAAPALCDTNVARWGATPFSFTNLLASSGSVACAPMRPSSDVAGVPLSPFQDAIAVFSAGHEFELREGALWTDAAGESQTFAMQPLEPLDVRVWLIVGSTTLHYNEGGTDIDVQALAQNHVDQALRIYDDGLTGLAFNVSYWPQASSNALDVAKAPALIGSTCPATGQHAPAPYWLDNAINVYYVVPGPDVLYGLAGLTCSIRTDKLNTGVTVFIYLGTVVSAATLAHELGHVLGLNHSGGMSGDNLCTPTHTVDTQNLMYKYMNADLHRVALGQVFRMNVDAASAANVLRPPRLSTRTCSPDCRYANSGVCPSELGQ